MLQPGFWSRHHQLILGSRNTGCRQVLSRSCAAVSVQKRTSPTLGTETRVSLCLAGAVRSRRSNLSLLSRRPARDSEGESNEDALARVLPFVAAGAIGLLAFAPALLVGAAASWWSLTLAGSIAGLLYFSVALPLLITVLTLGGLLLVPLLAANFFAATLLASLVAAGAGGLLVWVALGNPLPFQGLPLPWSEEEPKAAESTVQDAFANSTADDSDGEAAEDPFEDWDRRFARSRVRIKLEDLSSASKLAELRAYIAQAGAAYDVEGFSFFFLHVASNSMSVCA